MAKKLNRSLVLEIIDLLNEDDHEEYEDHVKVCLRHLCNCDLIPTIPENFDLIDSLLRLTSYHRIGPIAQYVLRRWEKAGTCDTNIGLPEQTDSKRIVPERELCYPSNSPLVDGISVTKKSNITNPEAYFVNSTKFLTHIRMKQ